MDGYCHSKFEAIHGVEGGSEGSAKAGRAQFTKLGKPGWILVRYVAVADAFSYMRSHILSSYNPPINISTSMPITTERSSSHQGIACASLGCPDDLRQRFGQSLAQPPRIQQFRLRKQQEELGRGKQRLCKGIAEGRLSYGVLSK